MGQKSATARAMLQDHMALFDAVGAVIESVNPGIFVDTDALEAVMGDLRGSFQKDYARVAEFYDLLFGKDITDYGDRVTALFTDWEREGGGPRLPAMIAHAIDFFGLDPSSPEAKAAWISSILSEIPNGLKYHGNEHYRKVMFHAIRLAATHNHLFEKDHSDEVLTRPQLAAMLIAACIHDLGHEGGDNLRDGVYTPGYMEQKALDIVRPYFEAVGLDRDMMGDIETLVFCTDITFFAGDNSPCVRMRKVYRHYFWQDDSVDVSMIMMGKLRRFEDNPQLVRMAMLLHEADIGTSAGVSYEQTVKETVNIVEERGFKTAGPAIVLAFLSEQLGETMSTEAGKQIFGAVMEKVIAQAKADIERGRKTYYED
ncbi:MAG: hypothetical protein HY370_01690 [Proteobacteria bacterium]|nr:hypothetical protein [Pseudomonadota bacterium]